MRTQKIIGVVVLMISLFVVYSCIDPEPLEYSEYNEWLSGGSQTVFDRGAGAFSAAFPKLSNGRMEVHEVGDAAFEATFVSAPAVIRPGLGPIFNNVSCASCHIGDGRGKPPGPNEPLSSLLFRLSIAGTNPNNGGPNPVPGYGLQLQPRSIFGVSLEATVDVQYTEIEYEFSDGDKYSLRHPTYTLQNAYSTLPADVLISPRVAPPVFGLGLLEEISESDILANADENDIDHNGISGKPNYVWSVIDQKNVLGRFGWKANNPSLLQQSAGAYNEDMGVTNFIFPLESSHGQSQSPAPGTVFEVSDSVLHSVEFYIRTLAVPARRNADQEVVLRGKQIFSDAQCSSCHKPTARTKVNVAFPEISNQVIFPYTDMLLHDMGSQLADNRPDFEADGQEWRTPPLWGIGLTKVVNGHNNFLHDGRARTLLEAVMWHGGEAQNSKDIITSLPKADRDALIKFLESL